jgi:hypothetical protein
MEVWERACLTRASHKKYLNRRNLRDRYIPVGKDYVVT